MKKLNQSLIEIESCFFFILYDIIELVGVKLFNYPCIEY